MHAVNDSSSHTQADDGLSVGTLSSHPFLKSQHHGSDQFGLVSLVLSDRNNEYEILHPLPVVVTMTDQQQGWYCVKSITASSSNHHVLLDVDIMAQSQALFLFVLPGQAQILELEKILRERSNSLKESRAQVKQLLKNASSKEREVMELNQTISKLNQTISKLKLSLQKGKTKIVQLEEEKANLEDQSRALSKTVALPMDDFSDEISLILPKKSSSDDEELGAHFDVSMQQKTDDVLAELMLVLEENRSESMNQTTLSQDDQDQKNKKYRALNRILQHTWDFTKKYAIGTVKKKVENVGMSPDDVDEYVEAIVEDAKTIFSKPE